MVALHAGGLIIAANYVDLDVMKFCARRGGEEEATEKERTVYVKQFNVSESYERDLRAKIKIAAFYSSFILLGHKK